jgi:hypothetical protein
MGSANKKAGTANKSGSANKKAGTAIKSGEVQIKKHNLQIN